MIYGDNDQVLAPGMVFFVHMILLNSRTGLSMCLGAISIVSRGGRSRRRMRRGDW
jgi:Xaa-Pro dipeptidase